MERSGTKSKAGQKRPDPLMGASAEAAGLLKVMASPIRLRILCLLVERELPVGKIAERLEIRLQAASQQLTQLRLEGLIVSRKDAQRVFYSLASPKIEHLLATLRDIYCAK
jgi:DNA-binding transcriptional ArsR family regulator